jgi:hypothetical protein
MINYCIDNESFINYSTFIYPCLFVIFGLDLIWDQTKDINDQASVKRLRPIVTVNSFLNKKGKNHC